jgi:hypothetical protein
LFVSQTPRFFGAEFLPDIIAVIAAVNIQFITGRYGKFGISFCKIMSCLRLPYVKKLNDKHI